MPMHRKKQIRRRRKYTKRKQSQVVKLERRVKALEKRPELKYFDTQNSIVGVLTTGTLLCPHFIPQGDDFDNRIGEELTAKFVNYRIRIWHTPAPDADQIRFILFWDRQCNGGAPGITVTGSNYATALLDNVTVPNTSICRTNNRTSQRYKILYDKVHTVNPDTTNANVIRYFSINRRLSNARIKFDSSSGSGYSHLTSRTLNLLVITGQTVTTTTVQVTCRFWYIDL